MEQHVGNLATLAKESDPLVPRISDINVLEHFPHEPIIEAKVVVAAHSEKIDSAFAERDPVVTDSQSLPLIPETIDSTSSEIPPAVLPSDIESSAPSFRDDACFSSDDHSSQVRPVCENLKALEITLSDTPEENMTPVDAALDVDNVDNSIDVGDDGTP